MSQQPEHEKMQHWMVSRCGRPGGDPFTGSLHDVIAHINQMHGISGIQYIACEVRQESGARHARVPYDVKQQAIPGAASSPPNRGLDAHPDKKKKN